MLVQFKLNQAPGWGNVFIVGSSPGLGSWNPDNAVQLHGSRDGICTE